MSSRAMTCKRKRLTNKTPDGAMAEEGAQAARVLKRPAMALALAPSQDEPEAKGARMLKRPAAPAVTEEDTASEDASDVSSSFDLEAEQ